MSMDHKYFSCSSKKGNIECLIWALENGCPWESDIFLHKEKHYAIMKWLDEHGYNYIKGKDYTVSQEIEVKF